ncbi:hypothetical protein ABK040_015365 [Willaertia magna]
MKGVVLLSGAPPPVIAHKSIIKAIFFSILTFIGFVFTAIVLHFLIYENSKSYRRFLQETIYLQPKCNQACKTDAAPWTSLYQKFQKSNLRSMMDGPYVLNKTSVYVVMKDSAKIACDVYVPLMQDGSFGKYPAIFHGTRYHRCFNVKFPFSLILGRTFDVRFDVTKNFIEQGYSVVSCDVRGTGASGGTRKHDLHQDEINDLYQIVEWIINQPWSNQIVGGYGISYDGMVAEALLSTQHPSIKAIAPLFSPFDLYRDVAWPNGLLSIGFLKTYSQFVSKLELNQFIPRNLLSSLGAHIFFNYVVDGVALVPGEESFYYNTALKEHEANYDLVTSIIKAEFSDIELDWIESEELKTIEYLNQVQVQKNIIRKDIGLLGISSWLDGSFIRSTITRHLSYWTKYKTLIIGPFDHGGIKNSSPFAETRTRCFDLISELIGFFDYHLKYLPNSVNKKKNQIVKEEEYEKFNYYYLDSNNQTSRVRYFVIQQEEWKQSEKWPPKEFQTETLVIDNQRRLVYYSEAIPHQNNSHAYYNNQQENQQKEKQTIIENIDQIQLDYEIGTGVFSRWHFLFQMDPRALRYEVFNNNSISLLNYTTYPLQNDIEITGHPYIDITIKGNNKDAILFCYLLELNNNSERTSATYISEGFIRALHRKFSPLTPSNVKHIQQDIIHDQNITNVCNVNGNDNGNLQQQQQEFKNQSTITTFLNNMNGLLNTVEPFRSFSQVDATPLTPNEFEEIRIFFYPISYKLKKGNSLALAISGWDKDNFDLRDVIPNLSTKIEIDNSKTKLYLPMKRRDTKYIL